VQEWQLQSKQAKSFRSSGQASFVHQLSVYSKLPLRCPPEAGIYSDVTLPYLSVYLYFTVILLLSLYSAFLQNPWLVCHDVSGISLAGTAAGTVGGTVAVHSL